MRAVHKFQFTSLSQPLQVLVSREAKVVLVDVQAGVPTVWVDDRWDESLKQYRWDFMAIGTGHPIPDNAEHVGSYQQGPYVWHIYQLRP